MNKKTAKKFLSALFFLAVFGLTIWAVFRGENPRQILMYLSSVNDWYILPAVVCVVAFILGESVVIYYLMHSLGTVVRFSHCCLYSFIGFFYSAITPSASGGQPMQVIAMRKDNIPAAVSTVVLAIVTITYKLVLVVIGLGVMLLRPARIMVYLESVAPVIYLGLALNVIFIALLLMVVFHPSTVRHMASLLLTLVGKFHSFRNPEKLNARVERIISQYQGTADYFKRHPFIITNVFIITLIQRLCLFSVVWFTYRAFRISGHSFLQLTLLYGMISVAADMLPLPGGMGISESLFLTIFEPIFSEPLVLPAMVICRGIGYYTQLIISAVMTGLSHFIIRDRGNKLRNL